MLFRSHCLREKGKDIQSEELLKSIISYTDKNLNTPSINHLFGLLAYKKLGKEGEAGKLLKMLEEPVGEESMKNEVALAFYKNDLVELTKLKKGKFVDEGTWNILEASLTY